MKHTTEELLLALAVRERLTSLRMAKIKNMTDEEVKAFDAKPINELIEIVMKEIDGIANVITSHRSRAE